MLTREDLRQIGLLLRPFATRAANSIARGVVQLVRDDRKMQLVQLGVLVDETIEGAGAGGEHFEPYGLTSVAEPGAEAVVVFPNGDRGHPLVLATSDRRYRPTGGAPGDVTLYHRDGARVILLAGGDIEIRPGPGGEVLIRDEGGAVDRLVKKSEHDGHTHDAGTLVAPSGGGAVTGATAGAPAVTGTQRVRAQ